MKTLEQYLRENLENNIIDHAIRSSIDDNGDVTFYIHAANHNSDTLDFLVNENNLSQNSYVTRTDDLK